ncbi:MAG: methyltransferase domain-containing protein, partial [Sedimentisphaerales bacterium]|nr:methyltransferase domain-containing protein [Sedimentisphaerales bacterium]
DVEIFDQLARRLRDKGWQQTDMIIKAGINAGMALEIGSGPGYVGLEWLKKTDATQLKGLDISHDMVKVAKRNTKEYGFDNRVEYIISSADKIPFNDNTFDGVFSTSSLHEWSKPEDVFNEIYRVLKPSGKFCIADLRRDMSPFIKFLLKLFVKPKEIKPGFITSINASYTASEIEQILLKTNLKSFNVKTDPMGLCITGEKS